MHCSQKYFVIALSVLCLLGCDELISKAGTEYLKISLKDACGEDDNACISAVEEQFDSCHEIYENEWNEYMDSSLSEEDELLEKYSSNMYECIVDENGDAYFYFDPESV